MFLSETIIDPTFNLVPWVVFLPLVGLLVNLLFGRWLGEKGIGATASLATFASFVIAALLAAALGRHEFHSVEVVLAEWITISKLSVAWSFCVDTLSVAMMLVVSGVGTLIHIYATGYMRSDVRHNGDPARYRKFFIFFNLFIVMMMVLVSASNYLMLFVGWEGVGLCSYLLIGFWFEKGAGGIANAKAAKKAFVVNRIGDLGLLIAIFMMFWFFKSLDFSVVFTEAAAVGAAYPGVLTAITLLMIMGVMGKSAQFPLYIWLPDAMAGPTPVSALIHAATMVTAGVYLVARSAPLYVLAPQSQAAVMWVGAFTAIFAAGIAVAQFDIKKVLAYSTISQLGFMVAAVGMGAFVAGMFHLVTHAFFKALLFLSSGSVIQGVERGDEAAHSGDHGHDSHDSHHEMSIDPQDMRNMGGLRKRMPVTYWVYLIGALALSGIAPLAGFFSKDEILAAASHTSPLVYVVLSAAAFLTAFYMGRQVLMVFFGSARTEAAKSATESPVLVTVPLIVLAVLSVVGGALNLPGLHTLGEWLHHTIWNAEEGEFLIVVALLSLALALLGLFFAWLLYGRRVTPAGQDDPLEAKIPALFRGLSRHWWLQDIYESTLVRWFGDNPFETWSLFTAGPVDLKVVDNISAGMAGLVQWGASRLSVVQNGRVRSYALSILFGVVLVLAFLATR